MKAEVTIKIDAPGLEVALQSLAQAIANNGEIDFSELRTDEPTKKEVSTNAEAKKQSLAEKILELGGTPPEKGSVAKFQAAFEKVSANALAATEFKVAEEVETPQAPKSTPPTLLEDPKEEEEEEEEEEEVFPDVAEVRMLAAAVVKSQNGNTALGKGFLQNCLDAVGAGNLTHATKGQLKEIVPLMEEHAGKTLEQVVSETSA